MVFYVSLPLLLRYVTNMRSAFVLFVAGVMAYAVSLQIVRAVFEASYPDGQHYLIWYFSYQNFFAQLPLFAIGLLSYFALRDLKDLKRVVGMGAAFLLAVVVSDPDRAVNLARDHIASGIGFGLVTLGFAAYPK